MLRSSSYDRCYGDSSYAAVAHYPEIKRSSRILTFRSSWSWSQWDSRKHSQRFDGNSPFQHRITCYKGVVVCSSLSFLTTSTLLSVLTYKSIKNCWASRRLSQFSNPLKIKKDVYPQGYFWLVNLFMTGIPS